MNLPAADHQCQTPDHDVEPRNHWICPGCGQGWVWSIRWAQRSWVRVASAALGNPQLRDAYNLEQAAAAWPWYHVMRRRRARSVAGTLRRLAGQS